MPQRTPTKQSAPAEILSPLNGGYDGYTDVTQAPWKRWISAINVFSGAFGYLQRARFANLVSSPLNITTAIILQDSNSNLWQMTVSVSGITSTVQISSGTPQTVLLNDPAGPATYKLVVSTSGITAWQQQAFSTNPASLLISPATGLAFTLTVPGGIQTLSSIFSTVFSSLKFFALPGLSSYLMADLAGFLYSYDTGASYARTQRLNPYIDPAGIGSSQLTGPWSRESLGNILYEMNGQVKQAGRLANAATIEGWGLDAPDATPQVTLTSGSSVALTTIARTSGVVTATAASLPTGMTVALSPQILNITGVSDPSFNGSFSMTVTGSGPYTFTWNQLGQNVTTISSSGNITTQITKAVGRSYVFAWENANKSHVGAPSPATQYVAYQNQYGTISLTEPGLVSGAIFSTTITGTQGTQFSQAWVGRSLWAIGGSLGRIASVQSPTQLTLVTPLAFNTGPSIFQIYDPQATHIRLYATADGGATYFRIGRNAWLPFNTSSLLNGLTFYDFANAEPPNFPYTTEVAQVNNLPPPVGSFVNEYQGLLLVYGITGATNSFFYSNQTATSIGLQQESFAPLNQVTLPIANASINGMIEFPGALVIWSDKQDMFRLTGLLTDNLVTGVAASNTAAQQGATIARLPYALGCASPFAVDITPLGAIWLTPNAEVWLYTDTYAPRNIGRPIQDILNSINPKYLKLARVKYYHTNTRNWIALSVPTNGSSYNNTTLILDLDLLAANGSPSYFTFDMATNSPIWYVFQPGTVVSGNWLPRCDSLETVYEQGGFVRLLVGQLGLIQDIDAVSGGFGTEISVPNGTLTTHAWGNDSAFVLKRPSWIRFNTNRDPSMLATDGWTFNVIGVDDDFYTFNDPLTLALTPGVNDSSTLGGNPDFTGGLAFRHSPELYKIGGVNFIMGRRLQFQVNFPSGVGINYQLRGIQIGFSVNPPN